MKRNQKSNQPILLWAVDPFAKNKTIQLEAAKLIVALSRKRQIQVQPIYAVEHAISNIPENMVEELCQMVRKKAQSDFQKMLKGTQLKTLLPLCILEVKHPSLRAQVDAVIGYGKEIGAETIIATTRARKGPARWFLGSFVESLSLRSPIPMLIVNPNWIRKPTFQDILFPTDFSEESHQAFQKVIAFAREMGSRIHIYHKVALEVLPTHGVPFVIPPMYSELEKENVKKFTVQAEKWAKESSAHGVFTTFEVDTKGRGSIVSAILKKSEKAPFLVALAAQSGPFEAILLGSVTRQILREARVPVWIVHPEYRKSSVVRPALGEKVAS